jgi:ATP-binding cassette subfamily B protein
LDGPTDPARSLPDFWRPEVQRQLQDGESLLAWFEPDLDQRLRYAKRLVLLTDRRLLGFGEKEVPAVDLARNERADLINNNGTGASIAARNGGMPTPSAAANGSRAAAAETSWQAWPLVGGVAVECRERGGAGSLEIVSPSERLAHWRYTPIVTTAAHQFAARVTALRQKSSGAATTVSICPSCGSPITSDDGVCQACANTLSPPAISSLFRLIGFARPWAARIALGFLITLAGTAVSLVPTWLAKPLVDDVLTPYSGGHRVDKTLAAWLLAGFAGAALLAWLLEWPRTYILAWVSERISSDLRNKTYAHLQWLSLEFFGGKRTGDLIARIGSDTDKICTFLSVNLVSFASDLLMMLMTAVLMLSMDPRLAVVSLVPFPVIVWLVYRVRARLRRNFRQASVAWGEMISVLADTIPGVRVVKAFAQENREIDRFGRSNRHVVDINDRVNVTWSFFGPTVKFSTDIGLLVVWAYGCWQVFHSGVTVGVLTAFVLFISRFFTRIESLIFMVSATQRAAVASQRIFEILDRVPSVADPVRPVRPGRLEGAIELRGVRFKYGTREVLHGLDLAIRPGEMIGLVGASGAGKSTLINLICRFYDVAEGAILADGIDIRSFPKAEYRANVGIVLQDPFLFYGTIAENIAYGSPHASHEQIVAAARAARAHEFILRLPDGYDSLVGERGQTLSGGERQRISIARALLIDPRILILDEATSSVDTETEREIQAALENLIRGRTTLAIAHRLSTLRRADRLVVLERGRIVEIGNHQELLERPGVYARLHQAQLEVVQGVGV